MKTVVLDRRPSKWEWIKERPVGSWFLKAVGSVEELYIVTGRMQGIRVADGCLVGFNSMDECVPVRVKVEVIA